MSHHTDNLFPMIANGSEAAAIGEKEVREFRNGARSRKVQESSGGVVPDDYPPKADLDHNRRSQFESQGNGREPEAKFYDLWKQAFDVAYQGLTQP